MSGSWPTFFIVVNTMTMERDEVIRRAWDEIEPALQEQGYELIELEYGPHGSSRTLRLFIDKTGGVTLNDCQVVSELVGALLESGDFLDSRYLLEVSSPGFDRPVRKPADFERFAGERITVQSHAPVAGRKQFKGELKGIQDGLVTVDCDGTPYQIHIENLKKAHLNR